MSQKVPLLYKICIENVASFLRKNIWDIRYEFNSNYENPLSGLPSCIIDELISCVVQLSMFSHLKHSDLYHLIATGQVQNFCLEEVNTTNEDIVCILMQLSSKCQNLVSIKLKNMYFTSKSPVVEQSTMRSNALECVLSLSPRLEYVESCIEFGLKSLRNAEQLKQLKLNFVPKTHLYEFLEEEESQFWPCTSLKVFDVFEDVRHPLSFVDIAIVLKHCPQLVEINCDVSKSLEYLHAEELYSGTLSAQYKLEKCRLGSIFLEPPHASVTRDGVYIASLTCPHLVEIDVLVQEDSAIYALSDFGNLKSLLLQWESLVFGDFALGVSPLLEKIGVNLKVFHLLNFSNIDFSLIGMCCPNLTELRVEYATENNLNEFSPTSFQNLSSLHIETIDEAFCRPASLVGLLSFCTQLKLLTIRTAEGITDSVLIDILKKNSLSMVKEVRLYQCALTAVGIRELASKMTSLEYFEVSSDEISFEEIAGIIHSLNPQVIMSHVRFA